MKKNSIITIVVIAAVLTAGVGVYVANRNDETSGNNVSKETSTQTAADSLVDKESADYKMYSQLTGEDYDRTFIANMIAHHQGAVDMATMALEKAQRQEIKDMAADIVYAQTKEINDLKNWQSAWGYPSSSAENMMDHSAMGTMTTMDTMAENMRLMTGEEFDKAFLTMMIEHHQSAINMAYPGQTNALHEEVKTLTKAIVEAQGKEIAQMKQWQIDWGY